MPASFGVELGAMQFAVNDSHIYDCTASFFKWNTLRDCINPYLHEGLEVGILLLEYTYRMSVLSSHRVASKSSSASILWVASRATITAAASWAQEYSIAGSGRVQHQKAGLQPLP
ncbi:MAG: hypothetical protein FRX49_05947 [Trebouxia sp. A1-2]|nr:MAG: hypothetical protein FRX49_05947 [Trebouxia sp. A1-2]